jgi:hypothetical protein
MKLVSVIVLTVAFLVVASASPVLADVIVTIKCTSGQQTATQDFLIQCGPESSDWTLSEPIALIGADGVLGTITELSYQSNSDPFVNLQFAVQAGNTDTTFDITSAVVSFTALNNPWAYASAGVTLTGDSDGATITGLLDGGSVYQATYNSSTVFASLVSGFTIPADQTVTQPGRYPASGTVTIPTSVSSIQSEFKFTLSALDQASGTSRFEVVVPEPATISLLVLGGLAMLRRNRK